MTDEVTHAKSMDLIPDAANANQHTERGAAMVESSIRKRGFRFAGTLDKNRRIVHGNHRHEKATGIGLDDVVIVKADPAKQYYLQFDDLDLTDPDNPARELAYDANVSAQVSIEFDPAQIFADLEAGLDMSQWFREDELSEFEELVMTGGEIDSLLAGKKSAERKLGDRAKQIKPVLYLDELATFENAIKATGLKNRGQAVIEICRFYLEHSDNAERQFDL